MKMQMMLNAPFLPGFTNTVAIPAIQVEYLDSSKTFIRIHFSFMISWAYKIHKSDGKTLDIAIINLVKIEKCFGITLVALSHVRKLIHLLPCRILIELLQYVNSSNCLPIS